LPLILLPFWAIVRIYNYKSLKLSCAIYFATEDEDIWESISQADTKNIDRQYKWTVTQWYLEKRRNVIPSEEKDLASQTSLSIVMACPSGIQL
jgi:hypothetical protein